MVSKKGNRMAFFAARVLCIGLLLAIAMPIVACSRGSDVPLSAGLSMIEGVPVYDDAVAMRTDHFTVTPGMMSYWFYSYGGALIVEMEKQVPYDATRSLHDQSYRDGRSFYDVLMNSTLQKISEMLIYCEAADRAGIALSAEQQGAIESRMTSLRYEAATYGMEAEAYLQRLFGPLMTATDLQRCYELETLASEHSRTINRDLESAISIEQIKEYAKANGLSDDTPARNMAYLVIPYAGGKPNEATVSRVLEALRAAPVPQTLRDSGVGSYGEESSLTPSNTGVAAISQWLFSDGRNVGDHGRVEAGNVTYVLIYTGNGMSFAEAEARMRLYDSAYAAWYNGWVEQLCFGYNYDVLDSYDIF
jgi:hypothetical protein